MKGGLGRGRIAGRRELKCEGRQRGEGRNKGRQNWERKPLG